MTQARMVATTPNTLIGIIERAEEVFGQVPSLSGGPLVDIPAFYEYHGSRKVIEWLKKIKAELES